MSTKRRAVAVSATDRKRRCSQAEEPAPGPAAAAAAEIDVDVEEDEVEYDEDAEADAIDQATHATLTDFKLHAERMMRALENFSRSSYKLECDNAGLAQQLAAAEGTIESLHAEQPHHCCPLTGEIPKTPTLCLCDNKVYDGCALRELVEQCGTLPVSKQLVNFDDLVPVERVPALIRGLRAQVAQITADRTTAVPVSPVAGGLVEPAPRATADMQVDDEAATTTSDTTDEESEELALAPPEKTAGSGFLKFVARFSKSPLFRLYSRALASSNLCAHEGNKGLWVFNDVARRRAQLRARTCDSEDTIGSRHEGFLTPELVFKGMHNPKHRYALRLKIFLNGDNPSFDGSVGCSLVPQLGAGHTLEWPIRLSSIVLKVIKADSRTSGTDSQQATLKPRSNKEHREFFETLGNAGKPKLDNKTEHWGSHLIYERELRKYVMNDSIIFVIELASS